MSIKIKLDPVLAYYANSQQSPEVDGKTVSDCLDNLARRFPELKRVTFTEDGKLAISIAIYLNGKVVQPDRMNKPVRDGDELSIVISSGG
ncbi:MAG: MoaD/ThiS family protein [Chloroflexota bacterium]